MIIKEKEQRIFFFRVLIKTKIISFQQQKQQNKHLNLKIQSKKMKIFMASLLFLGLCCQLTHQQQLNEEEEKLNQIIAQDEKKLDGKINDVDEESLDLSRTIAVKTTTTTTAKPNGYKHKWNKNHLNKRRDKERRRQERVDDEDEWMFGNDEDDDEDGGLFKPHQRDRHHKKHGKKCGHFNKQKESDRLEKELHKELRDVKREQKKIDRLIQQEKKIREMRERAEKRLSERLKPKEDLFKDKQQQQKKQDFSSDNYKEAKSNEDESF